MPLDARNYPPGTPIYTFIANDGTTTHVDAVKLFQWCEAQSDLETFRVPVERDRAIGFHRDNCISRSRVLELHLKGIATITPIIFGITGYTNNLPDTILIDGRHRYTLFAAMSLPFIPAYLLHPFQWKPFKIEGLLDMTHDQLRAAPVNGRRY